VAPLRRYLAVAAGFGLPSTPLKTTEKRAGDWLAAMRCEQTEIDALAALYSPAC
jgi:hypothetical protein